MSKLIDIFLHLDKHLVFITNEYGIATYAILFLIVFCETGLVVMPFLPGDSLLFAAGAISSLGTLHPIILIVLLGAAAIIGDTVNYWVGYHIGPRVFLKEQSIFFHRDHLVKAQHFYEKHGGKTIILARFMPFVRTFAPFVAGIGRMQYSKFLFFNIVGGIIWVTLFVSAGYFFGNIPFIQKNFHYVILGIIVLSILPALVHGVRDYLKRRNAPPMLP